MKEEDQQNTSTEGDDANNMNLLKKIACGVSAVAQSCVGVRDSAPSQKDLLTTKCEPNHENDHDVPISKDVPSTVNESKISHPVDPMDVEESIFENEQNEDRPSNRTRRRSSREQNCSHKNSKITSNGQDSSKKILYRKNILGNDRLRYDAYDGNNKPISIERWAMLMSEDTPYGEEARSETIQVLKVSY